MTTVTLTKTVSRSSIEPVDAQRFRAQALAGSLADAHAEADAWLTGSLDSPWGNSPEVTTSLSSSSFDEMKTIPYGNQGNLLLQTNATYVFETPFVSAVTDLAFDPAPRISLVVKQAFDITDSEARPVFLDAQQKTALISKHAKQLLGTATDLAHEAQGEIGELSAISETFAQVQRHSIVLSARYTFG